MTKKTPRPPKVRALEKLQKILTLCRRDGASSYEHFFWRDNTAVLRSQYDLGATKPGSLILGLGDKNAIVSISYDDAGPAWNCRDENSEHWIDINTWATGALNSLALGQQKKLLAENFVSMLWNTENFSAQSGVLMRAMAMEQWQEQPSLNAIVQRLLPEKLSTPEWFARALYLSETLITEKTGPDMEFFYKGVAFNSKYMLPWLLLVTLEQVKRHARDSDSLDAAYHPGVSAVTAYTCAMVARNHDSTETYYDWRVYDNVENPETLFSSPFHVRIVVEDKFGIFNHVRMGTDVVRMTTQDRAECIKKIYDIFSGEDWALSKDQAYRLDCQRLATLKNDGHIEKMDAATLQRALRIISQEWWPLRCQQGHTLLNTIRSLYPWDPMSEANPRAALTLLADMAALATPEEPGQGLDAAKEGLFEPD